MKYSYLSVYLLHVKLNKCLICSSYSCLACLILIFGVRELTSVLSDLLLDSMKYGPGNRPYWEMKERRVVCPDLIRPQEGTGSKSKKTVCEPTSSPNNQFP